MFKDNKYTKWYFNIINNAKNELRVKVKNDGNENHHIIPKCIGGLDTPENLQLLTLKEHFICHLLLTNMCDNKNDIKKMFWALHRLSFSGRKITSYQYELARKKNLYRLNNFHHLYKPENIKKHSEMVKLQWNCNFERKEKLSKSMKKNHEENKEFYNKHLKKISLLGNKAYKEKNRYKIKYKDEYYYAWEELTKKTGVTKSMYNNLYLKGYNLDLFLGCFYNKKDEKLSWITNDDIDLHWNKEKYPTLPDGFRFGRKFHNRLYRKEIQQI